MFEWLDEEIARIATRKFHLVHRPEVASPHEVPETLTSALPSSYREFVRRFGSSQLYRYGSNYYVTVLGSPALVKHPSGNTIVCFGGTWTSRACFRADLLAEGEESPVFEAYKNSFRQTASGFEEWLNAKCAAARKRFTKAEWRAIEDGPPAFSEEERAVVEARQNFRWRVIDIAPNGDMRFEVCNESTRTLPFLSIGIRGKLRPPADGQLKGGVYLPVAHLGPGEVGCVQHDCYRKFVAPEDVIAFALPAPEPEDREQYWEFRK
jgi:hypothetical protein